MTQNSDPLAELVIAACAEVGRENGEVMATGMRPLPCIGAGLAKLASAPAIQTTDGKAWYTRESVGPAKRAAEPKFEGIAKYDRVVSAPWSGKRHALAGPVRIGRYGQANIATTGQRELIAKIGPNKVRATVLKHNPAEGRRVA